MSVHLFHRMQELKDTDELFQEIIQTLQEGRTTAKKQLTRQEKLPLQHPQKYVTQIKFTSEKEGSGFITLQIQRRYLNIEHKEHLSGHLGQYTFSLNPEDEQDTRNSDYTILEKSKDIINGIIHIPEQTLQNFKPEIKEGRAVIKLKEDQFHKLLKYAKTGTLIKRISYYARFHASNKTEADAKILQSVFKSLMNGEKTYDPEVFKRFLAKNSRTLKKIINNDEKVVDALPQTIQNRYNITLSENKKRTLEKIQEKINQIPEKTKKQMINEINNAE